MLQGEGLAMDSTLGNEAHVAHVCPLHWSTMDLFLSAKVRIVCSKRKCSGMFAEGLNE